MRASISRFGVSSGSGTGSVGASNRYQLAILGLFSTIMLFSVVDLFTSFIAYGLGLTEGNLMLIGSSQFLGLSLFDALALSKLAFLIGVGVAAFFGARSGNSFTRTITFVVMVCFAVVFALVSANNLVAIGAF